MQENASFFVCHVIVNQIFIYNQDRLGANTRKRSKTGSGQAFT
eukprot:COSAG06_NODE_4328_length_4362_cov_5.354680_6_plen_43_part_00